MHSLRQKSSLVYTLARHELTLMEQGTPLGFLLAVTNNVIMLILFHELFVPNFLQTVEHPWLYLLIGIVHWNLFINISLGGFACLAYRQKILLGYRFDRFLLLIARVSAIFFPYLLELFCVAIIAFFTLKTIPPQLWALPLFLTAEFLFCIGIASAFAYLGVIHKNVLPFWNVLFRLLSFATPIFYLPLNLQSKVFYLYHSNPFTQFMLWARNLFSASNIVVVPSHFVFLLGITFGLVGWRFFRWYENKIGDYL